jgi:hypothetical protein
LGETTPILNARQIVEYAWRDQARWSETANRLKADLTKWRNIAAFSGVLGAFLETLAVAKVGIYDEFAWLRPSIAAIGAVILLIVPIVMKTRTSNDQVRAWVRSRSASEALKEKIFRYLVGASPFGEGSSPADLIKHCQTIKDNVRDLNVHAAIVDPLQKSRPTTLTIEGYISERVNNQIERYYYPKSRENAQAANRLHLLEFWLGVAAAAMGGLVAFEKDFPGLPALGPWIAVVTTATAAVTAHIVASRYDHQAMIYFSTAERLTGLRNEWLANPKLDPASIDKFVDSCEHAISTENEAWLAEWAKEQGAK